HVQAYARTTQTQREWRYQDSANWSRTLGESTTEIVGEMARQTPGAVLQYGAGVFDSFSGLPVVGGVFEKSATAFDDLSNWADAKTGADDAGKKARNLIARGT